MTKSDGYLILVEGGPPTNYSAWSPDVLGCVATGNTIEQCVAEMRSALEFHFDGMREHGEAIPEPSALEEVMSDPDNRSGVAILVSMKSAQSKAVRVNVTLPVDVLEQIDEYAEAHGYTRSGLLTQAAKKLMAEAA